VGAGERAHSGLTPDVLIIGAGPAGSATALFLSNLAPELARHTLVLEKRRHPRNKVCAGGLIPHTLDCLRELGVPLAVPHATVDRGTVRLPGGRELAYEDRGLCTVVRRSEFDALLAAEVKRRGIAVHEDERALAVVRDGGSIRVTTERAEYLPKIVVGADGSGSLVRRALGDGAKSAIGRAAMCDLPADEIGWRGVDERRYVFDFARVADGLKGYLWEFPCWIDGRPHVNVGAYAVDRGGRVSLTEVVTEHARRLGAKDVRLEAFPIRWYDGRSPVAAPNALLVGDAAGCDPLMGEGISYAFEHARSAASAVVDAFATGDFRFARHSDAVRASWFGRKLRRLGLVSRVFYGPTSPVAFAIAARSRRLQDVGVRWYNGVDGWDRERGWRLARRLVGGD
jgi:flavin-dependent dehydrogenase